MKKSLVVTGLVLGLACAFVVFTPGIAQAGSWSIGIGPGYIGVGHGHGHGHYHGGYHGGYHGHYHGG
ncbi:MAG: cation transporter, partial [Candidatus Omnitrophica bacterium]|nr:cation transporter [Candidatus Omnitrophota bacterium]